MATTSDPLSDALDDEKWELSKTIFVDALEQPRADRRDYVRRRCGGDRELEAFVLDLLTDPDPREDSDFDDDRFLEPPDVSELPEPSVVFEGASGVEDASRPSGGPRSAVRTPYRPGEIVGRRYRLGSVLGRGAGGEVFVARDELLDREVAVKILEGFRRPDLDRVRQEIAALRLLRLPGVVHMVDEGTDRGHPYIAMEVAVGARFPGAIDGPCAWSDLVRPLVALLETLERVHVAGFLHRDLKPSNVVVDEAGRVTVLDLGLAWRAVSDDESGPDSRVGTPAYMAPERHDGSSASVRSDLYSVGVMAVEALAGRRPENDRDARRRLAQLDLPADARRLLAALLAEAPDDRPASANEALDLIGGEVRDRLDRVSGRLARLGLDGEAGPWAARQLEPLFEGPELLFHLPTDAAAELHRRTGGDPERVAAELARWLRAGLAHWSDTGRLVVPRTSLDRLAAERGDDDVLQLIRDDRSERVPAVACRSAVELRRKGATGRAMAVLLEGLRVSRNLKRPEDELAVLEELAITVRFSMAIADYHRTIHELEMSPWQDDARAHLANFLRASLRLVQGDAWDRSLDSIERIPPFARVELELARQAARVYCARRGPVEREVRVVQELEEWAQQADDPAVAAALSGFRGGVCYRRGEYLEAAEQHACAAERTPDLLARVNAMLGAASALMEARRLEEAAEHARRALDYAVSCRNPGLEAKARWLSRATGYRLNQVHDVDLELIDAVRALDVAHIQALIFVNEVAIAWRRGDLELGRALAKEGAVIARAAAPGIALLSDGLVLVCAEPGDHDPAAAKSLFERASSEAAAGIAVQTFALIRRAGYRLRGLDRAIEVASRQLDDADRRVRREILSVEEATHFGSE